MSRRHNLSYSAHTPSFLRRLRGELPSEPSTSGKYLEEAPGGKAKDFDSDDETTVPEYIFKGETITKEEFEELQRGKNIEDIKTDRLRRDAEKDNAPVYAPDQTASSKPSANISEFGSRSAKRKVPVKIRRSDSSEEEKNEIALHTKRNKSVPEGKSGATKDERKNKGQMRKSEKSKLSRVQLSFGDDDE
ncbi:hypothetical protein V1520DRAFT_138740 [Lipomyces starkeyi]|uniref:DUF4604 domain-containing protein n=1 Tax=Lipomyces starkeyi NRRL Y-11557 TaxID=675824 RepID=A0A1E3QG33_LIPST|nr:hypothetical protein LIPSTDRAFT_60689 [Lipomyces starkeyi NRRL Y-11557]